MVNVLRLVHKNVGKRFVTLDLAYGSVVWTPLWLLPVNPALIVINRTLPEKSLVHRIKYGRQSNGTRRIAWRVGPLLRGTNLIQVLGIPSPKLTQVRSALQVQQMFPLICGNFTITMEYFSGIAVKCGADQSIWCGSANDLIDALPYLCCCCSCECDHPYA